MRDANMFGELVLIIAAIEQKTAAAAACCLSLAAGIA